jgi:hypothetical protein
MNGNFMLAPDFSRVKKAHKPQILNGFKRFESASANIPPVSPLSQRGENPKNHKSVIDHDFYFRPIHRETCWERSLSGAEVPSLRPPSSLLHPPFSVPQTIKKGGSWYRRTSLKQSKKVGHGIAEPPSKNLKGWVMVSQNPPPRISKGGSWHRRTSLKVSQRVGHGITEPPSKNLRRWVMESQSPPQTISKGGSWFHRAPLKQSQRVAQEVSEIPWLCKKGSNIKSLSSIMNL